MTFITSITATPDRRRRRPAVSKRSGTNGADYYLQGYAVADVFAAYKMKLQYPVTLQVNVKNLFDKTYYTSSIGTNNLGNQIGDPREVQFTVKMDFKPDHGVAPDIHCRAALRFAGLRFRDIGRSATGECVQLTSPPLAEDAQYILTMLQQLRVITMTGKASGSANSAIIRLDAATSPAPARTAAAPLRYRGSPAGWYTPAAARGRSAPAAY